MSKTNKNIILASLFIVLFGSVMLSVIFKGGVAKPTSLVNLTRTVWFQEVPDFPLTRVYHFRLPREKVDLVGELFTEIISIEGIQLATVIPYTVTITHSPIYNWGEINIDIIELVREFENAEAAEFELEETTMKRKEVA